MSLVKVDLGHHQYEIHVENALLESTGEIIKPRLSRSFVAIVTDENVQTLYFKRIQESLTRSGIQCVAISVPAGETSKSWKCLEFIVEEMLEKKVERNDFVIALGGGVIGDLVGFASAILRRGVRFIQIPTTLLAQVDSSVGGKTGINSAFGKNLIGAFHQPEMVISDLSTLRTLAHREFLSGYGEVAKYGLLGDSDFFDWLESNVQSILGLESNTLAKIVTHSCQMKADIVAKDEKERGERAYLNLGHTFGHALEKVTGYSERLLHGEGVAIGTILAFQLSEKLGICPAGQSRRIETHFKNMGMKTRISDIGGAPLDPSAILAAMYQDKKVKEGNLVFVLPKKIGEVSVVNEVNEKVVLKVLEEATR